MSFHDKIKDKTLEQIYDSSFHLNSASQATLHKLSGYSCVGLLIASADCGHPGSLAGSLLSAHFCILFVRPYLGHPSLSLPSSELGRTDGEEK